MQKIKHFVITSFLGGLLVILPAAILFLAFRWVFRTTTGFVSPIAEILTATNHVQETLADILALGILFVVCFMLGLSIRTRVGAIVHNLIEVNFLSAFPGYQLVKDTVSQFIGSSGKSQFSRVALVRAFDNEVLSTAFITATHADGSYTVFIPTAPNPTSGLIMHLPASRVTPVEVSVENAMKTVIGCGAGSQVLFKKK
ncbi:MAG: DUF502 domain-containing protein [Pseudomonadota bacterium]|nr:DUF502 domain-containing protein [Pseudomonadota bacterium]